MKNLLLQQVQVALQNKTQKDAFLFVDEVVDFLLKNEKHRAIIAEWSRDMIRLLVSYHWAKETLITIRGKNEELTGVFMYYRLNYNDSEKIIDEWLPDNDEGDSYLAAFCAAENNAALKQIVLLFLKRNPDAIQKRKLALRMKGRLLSVVEYNNKLLKRIFEL